MIMPAITKPDYALFATDIANENRLSPSHLAVAQGSEAVQFFKFTGLLMGKALMENVTVPATFTRFIFKVLLNEAPHVSDIVSGDPELAAQLMQLENEADVSESNIPFSLSVDTFGEVKEVELIPNGANIQVTNDNRIEFIRLCAQHRLVGATEPYILALRDAFHSLISPEMLHDKFTPEELEVMVCGQPIIDMEDWKNHTVYTNGFTAQSLTAVWFFEIIQEMVEVGRQLVLFFATGSRTPPALGFRYLPGGSLNETKPFELRRLTNAQASSSSPATTTTSATAAAASATTPDSAPDAAAVLPLLLLPVAHPAVNTVELPEYASKQQLMEALMLVLVKVNEKFVGK